MPKFGKMGAYRWQRPRLQFAQDSHFPSARLFCDHARRDGSRVREVRARLPRWPSVFAVADGGAHCPRTRCAREHQHDHGRGRAAGRGREGCERHRGQRHAHHQGREETGKEEKNENYYLAERSYGAFERSLRLPDTIDDTKVEAKFDKGVLKVTAAKKPEAVKAGARSRSRNLHEGGRVVGGFLQGRHDGSTPLCRPQSATPM